MHGRHKVGEKGRFVQFTTARAGAGGEDEGHKTMPVVPGIRCTVLEDDGGEEIRVLIDLAGVPTEEWRVPRENIDFVEGEPPA